MFAGGRPPPLTGPTHYFFFFLAAFLRFALFLATFFFAIVDSPPQGAACVRLEPHGLTADVRRLLAASPLVVVEIHVELGQADHGNAALDDGRVKDPGIVRS